MKAGDLKYRITIQQQATAQDDYGQEVEGTATDVATVWAGKWNLSTKDVTRQAGIAEQATGKFLIRRREGITTSMTVLFEGKIYKITGIEDYEDNVGLFLFVRSIDE